jgi:hypothetical protein
MKWLIFKNLAKGSRLNIFLKSIGFYLVEPVSNFLEPNLSDIKNQSTLLVRIQSRCYWQSYVNFSWLVLKSHAAYCYNTFACLNHTRAFLSHTCECGYDSPKSPITCENCTLRVEITLERVEITLLRV